MLQIVLLLLASCLTQTHAQLTTGAPDPTNPPVETLVVAPGSNDLLGQQYWQGKCQGIPQQDTYIKIIMGNVIDYYKPIPGMSICDMLQSDCRHQWSNDGKNWMTPDCNGSSFGGSGNMWPKNNVDGDDRNYLSFWGHPNDPLGGCCYDDYDGSFSWNRSFEMYYGSLTPEGAIESAGPDTIPGDYVSWLRSDLSAIQLTANGVVTSVTDANPNSLIQTIGEIHYNTADGFAVNKQDYFIMDDVVGAGTWTVYLTFKTTDAKCNIIGADTGGYNHYDTNVGFGQGTNNHIPNTPDGEFFFTTHYQHEPRTGVKSTGVTFNDGEWHWVEIYGGNSPHKYSLRFDTGEYFEETNVGQGWMRNNMALRVGNANHGGYTGTVKDVIVYNRYVSEQEAAPIYAYLNNVLKDGQDIDCVGDFGDCDANCEKKYIITTERAGNGAVCVHPALHTENCDPGEGLCPKECVCTNGAAVAPGDASCDVNAAERCQNCHAGYGLSASLSCEKIICGDKPIHAINEACFCAGHTDACPVSHYCYDAVCVDAAKYPTCSNDAYYKQSETCVCGTGAEATQCNSGRYCSNGVCSDAATCHVRSDIAKRAFYGAHLDGSWDSNNREMTISLPVSSHITVKSITWNQATDTEALRYSTLVVNDLWNVDKTDTCKSKYQMTVPQATFFGAGSHFVLNGTHMKTTLRVQAQEEIRQRVGTHDYTYTRQITNTVPLLVELKKRMTVQAKFKTTVPPSAKKTIKLDRDGTSMTDAEKDELLAQCTAEYGRGGKVVCSRVIIDTDGKIKIELDTTDSGTKSDLEDVIDDVEENGYVTPGIVAPVIPEIAHEEFVFLIGAEDNYEDKGMKTVTMTMEIHSRTCVNHTLADDTGVRYASDVSDYVDEKTATTTFAWKQVGGVIEQKHEFDLCVETLMWTFAPKGYVAGTYEIELEFTLAGDGMGTFTTEAEIELDPADVIADIGFTDTVKTYTGLECTDDQLAETFHIGDYFYAKISLGDMVVDAERITCDTAILEQTKGSETKSYDLEEDQFNFYQSATSGNSVVCGAELNAPLYASVTGYHTAVNFGILVDYKVGSGADKGTTAAPASERRFLRVRLSTDEAEARQYRDPEEDSISINMELLPAEESEVGLKSYLVSSKGNALPGALFLVGIGFSYMAYTIAYKNGKTEYSPLLELEL